MDYTEDYSEYAIRDLEPIAREGVVEAMYCLGSKLVQSAQNAGVQYDGDADDSNRNTFERGLKWLGDAAKADHVDAILELAWLYQTNDIDYRYPLGWRNQTPRHEQLESALDLFMRADKLAPELGLNEVVDEVASELESLEESYNVIEEDSNE